MGIFKEHFIALDLFAIQPSFFYKSKPKINTMIGAVFSILLVFLVVCLMIYFFSEMFRKAKPNISSYNDFSKGPDTILNTSNFFVGFILEGANHEPVDLKDDFYSYNIYYEVSDEDGIIQTFKDGVKIIPCREEFFETFSNMSKVVQNDLIQRGYCMDLNNQVFKGSPLKNIEFKGVKINLSFDTEKFYSYFDYYNAFFPIQVKIYYQSYEYIINDYHDPFRKTLGYSDFYLTCDFGQSYYFSFVNVVSKRDDNFFFKSINQTNLYAFSQFSQTQFYYHEDNKSNLISFRLNFEPYSLIYFRNYIKIQEVISQVVSFSNIGICLSQIIISFFGRGEVLTTIYHSHFLKKQAKKVLSINLTTEPGKPGPSDSVVTPINSAANDNIKDKKGIKNNYFTNQKIKLSNITAKESQTKSKSGISSTITLLAKHFKDSKKYLKDQESFEKSYVKKYLEIDSLIKNYDGIRRLEKVIFNSNQLFLFKNLETHSNHLEGEFESFDRKNQCCRYFSQKMSLGDLSDVDKRLLDMMSGKERLEFFGK